MLYILNAKKERRLCETCMFGKKTLYYLLVQRVHKEKYAVTSNDVIEVICPFLCIYHVVVANCKRLYYIYIVMFLVFRFVDLIFGLLLYCLKIC